MTSLMPEDFCAAAAADFTFEHFPRERQIEMLKEFRGEQRRLRQTRKSAMARIRSLDFDIGILRELTRKKKAGAAK